MERIQNWNTVFSGGNASNQRIGAQDARFVVDATTPAGDKNDSTTGSAAARNGGGSSKGDRYKTELCRPYEENGECRYGEKCQFAHGLHELRNVSRHPKYKTDFCRTFHTTGYCPYGARCHFIHSEADNRIGTGAATGATVDQRARALEELQANLIRQSLAQRSSTAALHLHHQGPSASDNNLLMEEVLRAIMQLKISHQKSVMGPAAAGIASGTASDRMSPMRAPVSVVRPTDFDFNHIADSLGSSSPTTLSFTESPVPSPTSMFGSEDIFLAAAAPSAAGGSLAVSGVRSFGRSLASSSESTSSSSSGYGVSPPSSPSSEEDKVAATIWRMSDVGGGGSSAFEQPSFPVSAGWFPSSICRQDPRLYTRDVNCSTFA